MKTISFLILLLVLIVCSVNEMKVNANDTILINQINIRLDSFSIQNSDSLYILANKALELSRMIHYKEGEAKSLNNLGVYFIRKKQYRIACYYLTEALSLFETHKNNKYVSQCLNNIGIIYLKQGELQKAENLFDESLKVLKTINDSVKIKQTLFNLAEVYQATGKYDKAIQLLQLIYLKEKIERDKKGIIITLLTLGELSQSALNKETALNYFNEALSYANISGKEDIPDILVHIAQNLFLLNRQDSACDIAIKAYNLSDSLENKETLKESAFLLSLIFENKKNYFKALDYLKQYNLLKDFENSEQVTSLNAENNFTTKILEDKTSLLQEKLSKKQLIYIILSLIFLAVLVIAILVIRLFKVRKRYYGIMELRKSERLRFEILNEGQEMERKRIARDLHDGLGQLLSTVKLTLTELQDSIEFSTKQDSELMAQSVILIDDACTSVREVSHALMPNALIRLGLVSAVSDMADKISKSNKIQVGLTNLDFNERLDEKTEITLYRIIQEIMNNIIKHSGANNAEIIFRKNENILSISVSDNGHALDIKTLENSKGIGWENLNSRVSMMNGKIIINPSINNSRNQLTVELNLNH